MHIRDCNSIIMHVGYKNMVHVSKSPDQDIVSKCNGDGCPSLCWAMPILNMYSMLRPWLSLSSWIMDFKAGLSNSTGQLLSPFSIPSNLTGRPTCRTNVGRKILYKIKKINSIRLAWKFRLTSLVKWSFFLVNNTFQFFKRWFLEG